MTRIRSCHAMATPLWWKRFWTTHRLGVTTGTAFEKQMLREFEACFNSMPIDEFYEERFGASALPVHSLSP